MYILRCSRKLIIYMCVLIDIKIKFKFNSNTLLLIIYK